MSRIVTFVGIGVILLVSIYAQRLLIDLIGPGTPLYLGIADVTWPVDGDVWADQMYEAISVWFIWIIRVGAIAVGLYNEFVRQNVGVRQAAAGGPP